MMCASSYKNIKLWVKNGKNIKIKSLISEIPHPRSGNRMCARMPCMRARENHKVLRAKKKLSEKRNVENLKLIGAFLMIGVYVRN